MMHSASLRPIAVVVGYSLLIAGAASLLPARADSVATKPRIGTDGNALIKAINFALTGSDAGGFAFVDRDTCVVSRKNGEGEKWENIETYRLDNVQADRIAVKWYKVKYPLEPTPQDWIEVALHGDRLIYEMSMATGTDTAHESDHTLKIMSAEHERIVRAWRFIYSHGCQSAASAF